MVGSLRDTVPVNEALLAIHSLEKQYPPFHLSVQNLEIRSGDVVGLLGANGAGKTTLIRSLVGIINADKIDVSWLGSRIDTAEANLKAVTGYVPEDPILYENERVSKLLHFVGSLYPAWDNSLATDLLHRFKIDPAKKVSMLSKGMHTKLLLLMALAHKPEFLILDEPTSGLDPLSRDDFWSFVGEMLSEKRIRAALISSHRLEDVARICNRAVFLADGRMVYDEREFSALTLKGLFESHRPKGRIPCF